MPSPTTAGHAGAVPPLGEHLRRLVALRPAVPVLSLYLDLDPAQFGTQTARRTAYTSLVDEAGKQVEAHGGDHATRASLRGDVERAAAFLDGYQPRGGRGLAIFSASGEDVFEAYTLPRPVRTQIVIGATPHVAPLIEAGDERDWIIVLVDGRHARFLHGNSDCVEEFERVQASFPGQHERSGTSDHQRWVEHHVDQHLKRVAGELDVLLGPGRFERVLVGGPPEITPRFEQQHMSKPARQRLGGRFEVEVPDTTPDDVRHAAAACFEEHERRHERELLERLAARLGRGERAVAGPRDVAAMLEQARVDVLLYDAVPAEPPAELDVERAVEDAVAEAAAVVPVRHHAGALAAHGHIAALLR